MSWTSRICGCHLDLTRRARAGTLSSRVKDATHGVAAVGAVALRFQVKLGLVRGKYLPAGLHAVTSSYVSASSLCAFRAALVTSVWSSKMPLADTPVILYLLDGPVGVDAFHVVWTGFRLMRRFLAHRPKEVSRIYRVPDLDAHGAPGLGPLHLLLTLAAEIGIAWVEEQQGWICAALPPLGMLAGPIQHFQSAIFEAWQLKVSAQLAEREEFQGAQFPDIHGSVRERVKM